MTLRTKFIFCTLLTSATLAGCELAVDFDRSKIPSDTPDSASPAADAATVNDSGSTTDASESDAADDAADDSATGDSSTDSGVDDGAIADATDEGQ